MLFGVSLAPYLKEFVFIALALSVLEYFFPAIRQPFALRTLLTDMGFWAAKPWVGLLSIAVVGIVAAGLIAVLFGSPGGSGIDRFFMRDTPAGRQPLWLQTIEVALCLDFCGYWAHRWSHRIRAVWRFHSVHHSAQRVTWMTTERVHPVDVLWARLFYGIPPLLIGFDMSGFLMGVTFLTFYAALTHANVPWSFGPLKYVFVTPLSHRWHHTSQAEGLDKNFGVGLVWMDMLFGTFYLPKSRQPEQFGVLDERIPENFFGQLAWPFRKQPSRPVLAQIV